MPVGNQSMVQPEKNEEVNDTFNLKFNQSQQNVGLQKTFHTHTQSQKTLSKAKYQNIIQNMRNKQRQNPQYGNEYAGTEIRIGTDRDRDRKS